MSKSTYAKLESKIYSLESDVCFWKFSTIVFMVISILLIAVNAVVEKETETRPTIATDPGFHIPQNSTTAIAVFDLKDPQQYRFATEVQYLMSQYHGISYQDDLRYRRMP